MVKPFTRTGEKAKVKKSRLKNPPAPRQSPRTRVIMSQKKRKLFLELLAQTGLVYESARALGYNSTAYLNQLRRDDEDFAAEWDIALESAALTDEERFLKKANERREGIESVLRNAPGKVKKYLTQGEKATYQNIFEHVLLLHPCSILVQTPPHALFSDLPVPVH